MNTTTPSPRGLPSLPAELKTSVLSFAFQNSAQDFLSLIWSCRSMYYVVGCSPMFFFRLVGMEANQIPMAVAHYHATMAPWKYSRDLDTPVPRDENSRKDYLQKVTQFCDEYLSKQGTQLLIPIEHITTHMIIHAQGIHRVIDGLARKLAPRILQLQRDPTNPSDPLASPAEIARISKCLYIIDLVGLLFPKSPVRFEQVAGLDVKQRDQAFDKFWSCFAPWESTLVEEMLTLITRSTITESPSIAKCIEIDLLRASKFGLFEIRHCGMDLEARHRISVLIMWKGIKKLAPLIGDRVISEDEYDVLEHMRRDIRFHAIRYVPWQNTRQWFVQDGFPRTCDLREIILHRGIIQAYEDGDSTAAWVWLWSILGWGWAGWPVEWRRTSDPRLFSVLWRLSRLSPFWDTDRIKIWWQPGPLMAMIETIGDTPIKTSDEMYGVTRCMCYRHSLEMTGSSAAQRGNQHNARIPPAVGVSAARGPGAADAIAPRLGAVVHPHLGHVERRLEARFARLDRYSPDGRAFDNAVDNIYACKRERDAVEPYI